MGIKSSKRVQQKTTEWHEKPSTSNLLVQFSQLCTDQTMTDFLINEAQNSLNCVLNTIRSELSANDISLIFQQVGSNQDSKNFRSNEIKFQVLLKFLSVGAESSLEMLTSDNLDPNRVCQSLFDFLQKKIISRNEDLAYTVKLKCEGFKLVMEVWRMKQHLLPEMHYTVELIPAFRWDTGENSGIFIPREKEHFPHVLWRKLKYTRPEPSWRRSYILEENDILGKNTKACFPKCICLLKAVFASDKKLAELEETVMTATVNQPRDTDEKWNNEEQLPLCVMAVLQDIRNALKAGTLNHHISGENLLGNLSRVQCTDKDGRLEELIFSEEEFTASLNKAQEFHKRGNANMGGLLMSLFILGLAFLVLYLVNMVF